MKRAALYLRVSTQEQKQNGLSVDSQLYALREYCKEHKLLEAGVYSDAGISGHITYKKRPALLQLIQDCQDGLIDIIIFTKLDRWFRSVKDYYAVMEQIGDIPWRAIWEDYTTEDSAGVFKVNIMLAIAEAEASRTSERIKAVNQYRREQGFYVGTAPTGYKLDKGRLIIDEEQRLPVKTFFETYLSTFDIKTACQAMWNVGGNIARDTAKQMLRNPAYCGDAFGGYKCEPYITREQFELLESKIRVAGKAPKRQRHTYYFTQGIFKCACCGCNMIGSTRNLPVKDGKKAYKWYRCVSARDWKCENTKSISELRVEQFLLYNIESQIKDYNHQMSSRAKAIKDVDKQRARLNMKLHRLGERYEDGDYTREEYVKKRDAIKDELLKLGYDRPIEKKALPNNWQEIYESLDAAHRRAFWYQNISEITWDGQNLDFRF
ncbi:recombinase family protein [Pseudobutyrivibrio sp.]|uniref:recombinase family protein n=1 Tax=Pseudobutyrivibrio sp. TaxID=2014367 RepID=UPI001D8969A0|nr:recombinase family protein [Pseudobutyrivibrio sp.]MBE5910921.1 hypothetical protein [Pseudobutyrivibrio sp.]